MANFYLVCYATEKYYQQQQRLVHSAQETKELNNIFAFREKNLFETDFYKQNEHILSQPRGAGYWLWKPYFIQQILKQSNEGDVVLYLDCHHVINLPLLNHILTNMKQDLFLVMNCFSNKEYTKRDCFVLMDCDNEYFYNATQLEAGICAFRKSNNSDDFVNTWLRYCQNENILTDKANVCGLDNLKEFYDHRHDQSVLTNLYHRIGLNSAVHIYTNSTFIGEGR